jgi:hypothetical protein
MDRLQKIRKKIAAQYPVDSHFVNREMVIILKLLSELVDEVEELRQLMR